MKRKVLKIVLVYEFEQKCVKEKIYKYKSMDIVPIDRLNNGTIDGNGKRVPH